MVGVTEGWLVRAQEEPTVFPGHTLSVFTKQDPRQASLVWALSGSKWILCQRWGQDGEGEQGEANGSLQVSFSRAC